MKDLGFTIDDKSSKILSEYLGTNLSKISNEVKKLVLNMKKGENITLEIIEENIGISKDFNIYELQSIRG